MSINTKLPKKSASTSAPLISGQSFPSQATPLVRSGTASGGQALDKHTQATMSARFGHNFSQVRIHTDARAGDSAASVGANAYAVGSDIVFGAGKYTPGSPETDRLLAHELTHVVQQSQLGGGDWGRMSQKGDASEREADSLASQVMIGRSVHVQAAPAAAICRYQAPDQEWSEKTAIDERVVAGRSKEANPILGNAFSLFNGIRSLGAAGYDEITGDKETANTRLAQAEDFGLNAIPFLGNRRAAKQAAYDEGVVAKDKAGVDPAVNVNSASEWVNGGADGFNESLKNIWDQF